MGSQRVGHDLAAEQEQRAVPWYLGTVSLQPGQSVTVSISMRSPPHSHGDRWRVRDFGNARTPVSLAPAVNRRLSAVQVVQGALGGGAVSRGDQGFLCQVCQAAGLEP